MKKQHYESMHMGGCQNYGPFSGTLNFRCRIIIGIQNGTIILPTTHMAVEASNPHTRSIVGGSWDLVAIRVEGFGFMRLSKLLLPWLRSRRRGPRISEPD